MAWAGYYGVWLLRYLRLKLGFNTLGDIKILSVEFSSVCNLRCKYCFLEKLERPKTLDIKIYEKLIKEIAENPQYRIKVMDWPISGEFFVYPEFEKVIAITRQYMNEHPHFRPHVILNDNLVLMDERRADLILTSGVVRQLICSIDGHDGLTFEDMRPPAKFPVMLKNMRYLLKRNKELGHPVFIQINNGRDDRSQGKALCEEFKELFGEADYVTFWRPEYWNESFNKPQKVYKPAKSFCSFVFNNVTLSSSGFISKCCMDLKGATEYGDLKNNTLAQIWHSASRRHFLDLMFHNKRSELKGCGTCSITNTNNDNRYTSLIRKFKRINFAWSKKNGRIYQPSA